VGGSVLIAFCLWVFWWCSSISLRIDVPGNDRARVFVAVEGTYHDGLRYETRELLAAYVPANSRTTFRVRRALPWRFDGLQVRVFHPGLRAMLLQERTNPHWGRAWLTLSPQPLAVVPESDSIAVGEIERHYDDVTRLYVEKLGLQEAALQTWPYLEPLRQMTAAVSFRLEQGAQTSPAMRANRMERLQQQWLVLESRLRSVQYLPCADRAVRFRNEMEGVAPGCGLRPMLTVR
jgi:hypothetical protein